MFRVLTRTVPWMPAHSSLAWRSNSNRARKGDGYFETETRRKREAMRETIAPPDFAAIAVLV